MAKVKIQIKCYFTGAILFEYESNGNTIKNTLIEAVSRGADLYGADLHGANLHGAKNYDYATALIVVAPEGSIIGWKMARNKNYEKIIVKLRIPEDAKRSNATGRKCRAEYAEVLAAYPVGKKRALAKNTVIHSDYDRDFTYKVGQIIKPVEEFNTDRWEECASGIHFFITRVEAENY